MITAICSILSLVNPVTDSSRRVDSVLIESRRSQISRIGHMGREIGFNEGLLLGTALQGKGIVFKQYANNGLSTITLRGADAVQTQVLWNGLPIVNPMLGILDFNLIQSFGTDQVRITEGANSAAFGSGAVGGTIELNQQIQRKYGFSGRLMQEAGSFGLFRTGIDAGHRSRKFYQRATVLRSIFDNNYIYKDAFSGESKRLHNASFNSGMERLVLGSTGSKLQTKLVLEHNNARRYLANFLVQDKYSIQDDENFRGMIEMNAAAGKHNLLLRYGIFNDRIRFRDSGTALDEKSTSTNQYVQLEWQRRIGFFHVSAGTDINMAHATVPAYGIRRYRTAPAAYAGISLSRSRYLIGGLARFEALEKIPTASINGEYRIHPLFTLLFNAGNSFRRPTMNDLYWGGINTELKSEKGQNLEASVKFQTQSKNISQLWVGVYYRDIRDAIRWVPGAGGFWSPRNYDRLITEGIQVWANKNYRLKKNLLFSGNLNCNYTAARVINSNSPESYFPIFIPKYNGNAGISLSGKSWSAGISNMYTGMRYTSTDNSSQLKAFDLWQAFIEYSFKIKNKCIIDLRYDAQNITGQNYYGMPNMPMPGQNHQLKLVIRNI